MSFVAEYIDLGIKHREDEEKLAELKEEVKKFSLRFPLPSDN